MLHLDGPTVSVYFANTLEGNYGYLQVTMVAAEFLYAQ